MSTTLIIIMTAAFLGAPVVAFLVFFLFATIGSTKTPAEWDEEGHPLNAPALAEKYGLQTRYQVYGYRVRGQLDDMVVDLLSFKRGRRDRKLLPSLNEGSELEVECHLPMPPGLAFGLHKGEVEPPLHELEDVLRPIDREYKGTLVFVADDPDAASNFLDDPRILKLIGLLASLGKELDFRDHTLAWESSICMEMHHADTILWHLTEARQAMREKFEQMSDEDARELPTGHW